MIRLLTGIGFAVGFGIVCAVDGGAVSAEIGMASIIPVMAATAYGFMKSDMCD